MPVKVKRGLGLLVVAAIALLLAMSVGQIRPTGDAAALITAVVLMALAVVFLAGLLGGLVLVAWGLLRD